jgi:hypothetical protein
VRGGGESATSCSHAAKLRTANAAAKASLITLSMSLGRVWFPERLSGAPSRLRADVLSDGTLGRSLGSSLGRFFAGAQTATSGRGSPLGERARSRAENR